MIADKKEFYGGVGLMGGFLVVLFLVFQPIYNGMNGLDYMDSLYNSISKGSAYYIPKVEDKAKTMAGKSIQATLSFDNENQADVAASLYSKAGANTEKAGASIMISGDLGGILDSALKDSEAMYRNDGGSLEARYSMNPRLATYVWWLSLKSLDKDLKRQKLFKEAAVVDLAVKRAVEPAYNYFGVDPQSITDRLGMVLFSLVFYVVYTMWYGFAILFMFEGWGLRLSH